MRIEIVVWTTERDCTVELEQGLLSLVLFFDETIAHFSHANFALREGLQKNGVLRETDTTILAWYISRLDFSGDFSG